MKRVLLSFAACAALVSCVQENELNPPQPREMVVKALAADTKTVLDGNQVMWEDGDEIALVLTKGQDVDVVRFATDVEGDEPVSATEFKGTMLPEYAEYDDDVVVVYPYSVVEDGLDSFELPSEQTVSADGSFASGLNLSSASISRSDLMEDGEAEASFKNALSILRFTLPEGIKSVSITGTSPLAGEAPLEYDAEEGCLVVKSDVEWTGLNTVYPKLAEGEETYSSEHDYNLLVWPGEHTSLTVRMTDTDGCVYEKTVERQIAFEASSYYTLDFNETFVKEFTVAVSGRNFAADDEIAVVLGELYNEALKVTVDNDVASVTGELPHTDETVEGYAVYPAAVAADMQFALVEATSAAGLYYAPVSSESLVAEDAAVEFSEALSTLKLVLPEGVRSVTVTSESALAGTAPLKFADNALTVDTDSWNEDSQVKSLTVTAGEGSLVSETFVKVYPGSHAGLVVRMTDVHGCAAEINVGPTTFAAGQTTPVDVSNAEFTAAYEMTLAGRSWGDGDQVSVALGDYKETLAVADGKVYMTLPASVVHEESLTGHVLYPASLAEAMTCTLSSSESVPELYSAVVDKDELLGGNYSVEMSAMEFATLKFVLPSETTSVSVTSNAPLAGTAPLKLVEGKLVVDAESWTEDKVMTVTGSGTDVVVFPGTHVLTVELTDEHDCTVSKSFESEEYTGEVALDLSDKSFAKQYTIQCASDVEGPIMVAFGEDEPVEVSKNGQFIHDSHSIYTSGYAFYPASAHTEGVSVSDSQDNQTAKPELYSAELIFDEDYNATADFTNAFATLTLTVPSGTTSVTLTSDQPLAGTMKVQDKEVVVVETGSSTTLTVAGSGTTFTAYVLPGTHTSLIAAIEDSEGPATKTFSDNLTFESGKTSELDLVNGLRRPVTLDPTAAAQHVYEDGILTGTQVVVSLNISDDTRLDEIESMEVTVSKNGTTYKSFSTTSVISTSLTFRDGEKVYIPQSVGACDVTIKYTIDGLTKTVNSTLTAPAPEFIFTTIVSTGNNSLMIEKASVNISQSVLNELPLSKVYVMFRPTPSGSTIQFRYNTTENNPTFISNESLSVSPMEYKMISSTVTFDNVEMQASDNLKTFTVKELKYSISGSAIDGAGSLENGALYVIHCKSSSECYWKVDDNGRLIVSATPANGMFTDNMVFEFKRDDTKKVDIDTYSSDCAGTWKSLKNEKYLSSDFSFSADVVSAQYLYIANKWRNPNNGNIDKGGDMDVYKADSSKQSLWYYGNFAFDINQNESLHGGSTDNRKWVIYKVTLVE